MMCPSRCASGARARESRKSLGMYGWRALSARTSPRSLHAQEGLRLAVGDDSSSSMSRLGMDVSWNSSIRFISTRTKCPYWRWKNRATSFLTLRGQDRGRGGCGKFEFGNTLYSSPARGRERPSLRMPQCFKARETWRKPRSFTKMNSPSRESQSWESINTRRSLTGPCRLCAAGYSDSPTIRARARSGGSGSRRS